MLITGIPAAEGRPIAVISEAPVVPDVPDSGTSEEPSVRDQLALVFIGYTSAKLCADAGLSFSAHEIVRIEREVTRTTAASGFTQSEQDTLWLDVLNSMARSKGPVSEQGCTEDKAMLRFQMPQVWADQPGEGAASGL